MLGCSEDDRQHLRSELFLGHLLTLAVASGAVPPHALPSLAVMLQARACGGERRRCVMLHSSLVCVQPEHLCCHPPGPRCPPAYRRTRA